MIRKNNFEVEMNFSEMYEHVKKGSKARRATWKKGEYLFWTPNFLIHNTPYFSRDIPVFMGSCVGYYYVVEKDDPVAKDWEIIK
jgi:hypothetical protein